MSSVCQTGVPSRSGPPIFSCFSILLFIIVREGSPKKNAFFRALPKIPPTPLPPIHASRSSFLSAKNTDYNDILRLKLKRKGGFPNNLKNAQNVDIFEEIDPID